MTKIQRPELIEFPSSPTPAQEEVRVAKFCELCGKFFITVPGTRDCAPCSSFINSPTGNIQ